jgi:hypothetical protein
VVASKQSKYFPLYLTALAMAKSGASLEEIHQQAAEEETQKSAQKLAEKELQREAKAAAAQAEKERETVKGKINFFTVVTLVHILNKCTHSELFHQLFISLYYSVAPASYILLLIFFNILFICSKIDCGAWKSSQVEGASKVQFST